MQVYCPKCNAFVKDAKMFRVAEPMPCPNCKTELQFTTNTESKAPLVIGLIILMMVLNTFGIIEDATYKVFLVVGVLVILGILAMSTVIAQEVEQ